MRRVPNRSPDGGTKQIQRWNEHLRRALSRKSKVSVINANETATTTRWISKDVVFITISLQSVWKGHTKKIELKKALKKLAAKKKHP